MTRRRGGVLLVLLGLLIAGTAAALVFQLARRSVQVARLETVDVLVASRDIPARTVVAPDAVAVRAVLRDTRPPTALALPEEAIGRTTTVPVFAGDFVLASKLAETGGQVGLSFAVPPGKVVVSFPGSDILTTGAIRPGDTVDLIVTIRNEPRTGVASAATPGAARSDAGAAALEASTTQVTLQNLEILAIGSVAPDPDQPDPAAGAPGRGTLGLLTFAVDRQDALVLKALKDAEGARPEFVLRRAGDDTIVETEPVTIDSIVDRFRFRGAGAR